MEGELMVPNDVYFFYLRLAFVRNHVRGYAIDKKVSGKICIFMEDGKWVVAHIKDGMPQSPKFYDPEFIWDACEDIISRVVKDDKLREKVWMEWASPTDLQEKWDEPLIPRLVLSKEAERDILPVVVGALDGINPWSFAGHGIPENFFMEADRITQKISKDSNIEEIAIAISDVINKHFDLQTDYTEYLEHAKQIYNGLHEK